MTVKKVLNMKNLIYFRNKKAEGILKQCIKVKLDNLKKFLEHLQKFTNFQKKNNDVTKTKCLMKHKGYVSCKVLGQGLLSQCFMETRFFYKIQWSRNQAEGALSREIEKQREICIRFHLKI